MLATIAEGVLNRAIEASSLAAERAAKLEGKRLAIQARGLSLTFEIVVRDGRVSVSDGQVGEADAMIAAAPLELLKLARAGGVGALESAAVELQGDAHTAEGFGQLLEAARPDFEGELAGWIGDVPAHAVGRRMRDLLRWSKHSRAALEADVSEYLQEEALLLPRAEEVRAFLSNVDRLRDDVERAAARLDRLAVRKPQA